MNLVWLSVHIALVVHGRRSAPEASGTTASGARTLDVSTPPCVKRVLDADHEFPCPASMCPRIPSVQVYRPVIGRVFKIYCGLPEVNASHSIG